MGTENPGRPNFPSRPSSTQFGAPTPTATPFSSSGPVAGSQAPGFRPAPSGPPSSTAFPLSRPVGTAPSMFNNSSVPPPPNPNGPPSMFSNPSVPPPPNPNVPPPVAPFQRFPTPQFPPTGQAPPSRGPSIGPPPVQSPPLSFRAQTPSGTMGPPPPSSNPVMGNMSVPPPLADSSFSAPRPNFQQTLAGYPAKQPYVNPQASLMHSTPFPSQQGNYVPVQPTSSPFASQQGNYGPPPSVAAHLGMQQPVSGPPVGSVQGLVEDFSSLSLGSIPGSMDPGLDPKALPRPLSGDVEPIKFAEMYPMNCDSRYLRLTTSVMPNSQSLASRWHLPLGAVVCPLAEAPDGDEVPIVNFASCGIIRCRRCRTYVNPFVTFTDAGRKWRCNICSLLNDVPGDYFAHLDATGRRVDMDQRPELMKGSVEFVAPTEYMVRPPMPPLYFFLIDVSISAVRSGMVEAVAETIRACLDKLPGYPRTQIGFITFDSTIHFYNMKSSLTQPQMMVVSDLDDIFVPLPDDLLVNLSESRSVVETFLDSLPSMFQENMNLESAFGPALKAAYMVMSQLGGKLLIFQNTLPSLGVARLRLRGDDSRTYGTDKEHSLRIPEDPFYKQMAADLSKYQIAVNVYAFGDKYTDIASLGTLAKYTGGQVYYYPGFQSAIHKDKLRHELTRDLTRETAWEAVMRIRCGKGVRFTSYHGNFMLRSTDLLALPAVDCDKAYAMQLSLEETLLTTQTVYFQVALLYTASCGERRIRVHTAAVPVVADLGEMYRQADTGAIVSLFSRLAIEKTLSSKLEDARNFVQMRIAKALKEYRNLYAVQHRLGGRMIYPEALKFLPIYGLSLCKSIALRGGFADASLDERCALGHIVMTLPVKNLLKLLYPSLIRVDEYLLKSSTIHDDFKDVRLPLAAESLDSRGIYVYDDGLRFIIWFGRMLSPEIATYLLGPEFAADSSKITLSERDDEMSRKLFKILKKLREKNPSYYQLCQLVRQGEHPREGYLLLSNLVEDRMGGTNGYVDWVLQLHRQIQQNA